MVLRYPLIALGIATILLVGTRAAVADNTCYCRTSSGERVAVGGLACLKTSGGMQQARCGFVLNNTAWKLTGNPCPLASRGGRHGANAKLAVIPRR